MDEQGKVVGSMREMTLIGKRLFGGPEQLNTINYMAGSWSSANFLDASFIGFLPISGEWNWGVEIDGVPCCAVHLFRTRPDFYWGDDERDTLEYATENPWVLMFFGSDNSSYFLRFPTREDALTVMSTMQSACSDNLLYFNS